MLDPVRQEVVTTAHTVVVKVGTNVLTDNAGRLDRDRVRSLAEQVVRLQSSGKKVALVSSGAIGAGVGELQLPGRPTDLPRLQACAAVGQGVLMQAYREALASHGVRAAQILLTASDFDHRARYLNARNTVLSLFEWGCLPIINENDTVSVAEIRFGDNDHLAAMVTNLLRAPLLVLLTNVDGLYSNDPKVDPTAHLLATVPAIDAEVAGLAADTKSALGTGGMRSKLRAARLVTASGEAVVMANGSLDRILDRVMSAEPVGTLFLPHGSTVPSWKRWVGYTAQPKGKLFTDPGARVAVESKGKSLLPIGVVRVTGDFRKGDVVAVCDAAGGEYARGLCNYSADDAGRLCGLRTDQIAEALGAAPYEELIHRDNLVVIG
ncbi:MAG: glutamate 5-kinase [Gemmataceae bacterium]|nr:glutamate 5-kinase [Gemmataceae bacterium]